VDVFRRWLAPAALLLAACGDGPERLPAIGEAYVAPPTLTLRQEIDLRSPAVATAKHGERVEILQRRRRFFRVRTPSGAEGWTDQRDLLNSAEMRALDRIEQAGKRLPPQGAATTLDLLNAHLEPYRQSPTVFQLREGDRMQVLAYDVRPRISPPRQPLLPPAKKADPPPRKKKPEPKVPPPPKPAPPPPPADWLELSKTPPAPEPEAPGAQKKDAARKAPPPPAVDDWALVRTPAGQVGWVLTSRLFMSIPDEVAQYAEGRRITSYFSLGQVRDGEQMKHHWLWTTIENRNQPYDYDSFRVFIWSLRRHRYETAYIERNRIGYFPTNVEGGKFSLCLEKDGQRLRRTYELQVNVVRFLEERQCEPSPYESLRAGVEPVKAEETKPAETRSWRERLRDWFR
jgi:hypothetical protein